MSLWQSYRNLAPRTRTLFGLGIMAWAGIGLLVSDQAEEKFALKATDADKEKLSRALPKIHPVDGDGGLIKDK
ncbi:hypothetical protein K490DRAFT_61122 [Saccharata proteae CBS 121410]|uniref:Uncharacterized protein n=1 Tax=Saccharata proteae CBS 121410 TaxID=1314787 RepID=A0A9P4M002_9PEZI|nr:hypothetical protein K490DRAFT_61122 [Saccharata proteae CBS 121410]